jgi:uncharacterized protein (TIGR03086 family)
MDVAKELENTLERNVRMVERVATGDLDRRTPCEAWTVRDLLNHMTGGNLMFAAVLRGEEVSEAQLADDYVGEDPAASYRASAEAATEAWRRPDALEGTMRLPFGEIPRPMAQSTHLMDQTVHRWDLARALGVAPDIDRDVAEDALRMMKNLPDAMRGEGRPFGLVAECPDDAPPWDRLAAWLGRDVGFPS